MQNNIQVQHAEGNVSSGAGSIAQSNYAVPRLDVLEDENDVIYTFELPGINRDSLQVEMGEGNLYVNARISSVNNRKVLHKERVNGQFYRQVEVGPSVNTDSITADYYDGILEVKFPKQGE